MMEHGESIYNLIPREYVAPSKPARHTSQFRATVKEESRSGKQERKSMGPARVPLNQPSDFLKKHEKEPKLPPRQKFNHGDREYGKPHIPKQDDQPLMGLRTTKNFVKQNAVEVITAVPKKPEKKYVDTRKGDQHDLIPSGLEPKYVHKKEYGDVPNYIIKRNEEVARAQAGYNQYIQEQQRLGAMKTMQSAERARILNGLKTNWENLHHEYQGLSVVTDTTPKKNRKERIEAEMKQLERDIELIEKHRMIYIAN